jgi:Holliday junction resolvase RusA-like endonuclease
VEYTFTVPGIPAPQGSKVRTRYGVREDNPATRPWRTAVAWEASALRARIDDNEQYDATFPLLGPLSLWVVFFFPRPKNHYGSGKNSDVLKPSAPIFHTSKPDGDKLTRAIGDSLTGVLVRDDSQFCDVRAVKLYGEPRAVIMIDRTGSEADLLGDSFLYKFREGYAPTTTTLRGAGGSIAIPATPTERTTP